MSKDLQKRYKLILSLIMPSKNRISKSIFRSSYFIFRNGCLRSQIQVESRLFDTHE